MSAIISVIFVIACKREFYFSTDSSTQASNIEYPKDYKPGLFKTGEDTVYASPIFLTLSDGVSGGSATSTSKLISQHMTSRCALNELLKEFTDYHQLYQERQLSVEECVRKAQLEYSSMVKNSFSQDLSTTQMVDFPKLFSVMGVSATFVSAQILEKEEIEEATSRKIVRPYVRFVQEGDSLSRVFRLTSDDGVEYYYKIVHASQDQQHFFNCPFQIATQFTLTDEEKKEYKRQNARSARQNLGNSSPNVFAAEEVVLHEHDIVLIGSDGIFDNLSDADLTIIVNMFMKTKFASVEDFMDAFREMVLPKRESITDALMDIAKYFLKTKKRTNKTHSKNILDSMEEILSSRRKLSEPSLKINGEEINITDAYVLKFFEFSFEKPLDVRSFDDFIARAFGFEYDAKRKKRIEKKMHSLSQVITKIAKEFSELTNNVSPFTVRAFKEAEVHSAYVGSKPDDVSCVAASIFKRSLDHYAVEDEILHLLDEIVDNVEKTYRNSIDLLNDNLKNVDENRTFNFPFAFNSRVRINFQINSKVEAVHYTVSINGETEQILNDSMLQNARLYDLLYGHILVPVESDSKDREKDESIDPKEESPQEFDVKLARKASAVDQTVHREAHDQSLGTPQELEFAKKLFEETGDGVSESQLEEFLEKFSAKDDELTSGNEKKSNRSLLVQRNGNAVLKSGVVQYQERPKKNRLKNLISVFSEDPVMDLSKLRI